MSKEISEDEKIKIKSAFQNLYKSTNGPNWEKREGFSLPPTPTKKSKHDNKKSPALPLQDWTGISFDDKSQLRIQLSNNKLEGQFPFIYSFTLPSIIFPPLNHLSTILLLTSYFSSILRFNP